MFPIPLRVVLPRRKEHPLNVHATASLGSVEHVKIRVAAMVYDKRLAVLIDDFRGGIAIIQEIC